MSGTLSTSPRRAGRSTPSLEQMLAVVEHVYDAALDESRWPSALRALTAITDSQAASFWVLDGTDTPRLPTFIYVGFDPVFIREYLQHMTALDPTVQYLVAHPKQPIVHDGLVISERAKRSHAYYDWHSRYSDTRFRLVGQTQPSRAVQAGIALHRARQTGRYEPGDIERFALLRGHLQRALRIGVQLASMGGMCRFNTEWLERSPAAVVLFDEHQRVLFANRSARALQGRGSGVRLSPAGLTLAWQPDDEKLQSLLRRALASLSAVNGTPVGVMRAARPSGRQPYTIIVSAVTREMTVLSQFRPAACVVVTDPERRPISDAAHLQAAFGLTRAESQLAALLAAGEKLRLAADKLDITYGTARTRLTQIFQKTGTRGQGELIRLLLTLQT